MPDTKSVPERQVALLRGINLAGHNTLPMAALRDLFIDIGCHEVETYIQSGNVVFRAEPALVEQLPSLIREAIGRNFGYDTPVVLRSGMELDRIVASNPYVKPGVDEKQLHVGFLADRPTAARLRELEPDWSPPDEFTVKEREIYLRLENGMARTKLNNAYFDSRLATTVTMRNWRTTGKLLQLVHR